MSAENEQHAAHTVDEHELGEDCSHQAVEHEGHIDYMRGELLHAERDGHCDEH